MQGGKYLVARERGAKGHAGGVFIADLADQDDVGVLAHQGADPVGEIQPRRFIDRDLPDQRGRVFDRVFEGHDIDRLGIEVMQDGIERGGLAAAGRPADQDDPLGPRQHPVKALKRGLGQAQPVQRDNALLPIEHAQDDVFAMHGGQGRDPEIHGPPGQGQRQAAILGGARLGDIHARHDLEPHRERRPVIFVEAADLPQDPVDAVAKAQKTLLGFEVNIGGVMLDGVGQQRVHEAGDGLAVLGRLLRQALIIDLAGLDLAQDAIDRQFKAIKAVDGLFDLGLAGQHRDRLGPAAQMGVELIQRRHVKGVGHGHLQATLGRRPAQRQHAEAARQFARDHGDGLAVGQRALQVHALLADHAADHIPDHGFGGKAEPHQDPAQVFPALFLLDQGDIDLVAGGDPALDQYFTEARGDGDGPVQGPAPNSARVAIRLCRAAGSKCAC